MWRTSSRRSISLHPGQNGRCTIIVENSEVRIYRYLDTSTRTQMAKIMVQNGRSSRFSWTKSVRSSLSRTVMGKAIWENPIETWMGENSKLGMSLCSSWKRNILICVCGWHKIGWKETKSCSDVDSIKQRSRFGRTNIFLGSCIFGLHSKTMWNKQKYCGQLITGICLNPKISAGATEKLPILRNLAQTFPHGPTIWKVMQRNARNDIANWRTKQLNSYTKSQLHVLTTINSRKKKWDLLENCQQYAPKLFWNACIWLVLVDLTFEGPWTTLLVPSQNGPELATNAQHVWFITFITHVNSNNIVMWEIQHNNADWDYFKILILPETQKIQNQHQEESYAFSEVTRSCQ